MQYLKTVHSLIVPGVAKFFSLEVYDTTSTAGSICTCRLHPSCCAGTASRPDLRLNSLPVYLSLLSAFRVASAVTQQCFWDLLGFSTHSSIHNFVYSLVFSYGIGTHVTNIYAVLLTCPPHLYAKKVDRFL